jgi:hypothetical protein
MIGSLDRRSVSTVEGWWQLVYDIAEGYLFY